MTGIVEKIYLASQAQVPIESVDSAELIPSKGIVGDRYYFRTGTFSDKSDMRPDSELTLIESEEILAFNQTTKLNYSSDAFRRSIVTKDIRLEELIGKSFFIGEVELKGIRFCEPCAHLAGILGNEIMTHMIHKTGIRAQILKQGTIKVSDAIMA